MELKRTPLNQHHKLLGGKMVPFAGWEMPVQYKSALDEHLATRNQAGLFDVSHMGEILVKGKDATRFLDSVTCNSISTIQNGQVQYNAVPNARGGLIDDITVYKVNDEEYFVVSNASNYEAVAAHFKQHSIPNVQVEDQSLNWHQIALQGPMADSVMSSVLQSDLSSIEYYHFTDLNTTLGSIRISRTGYTGEDGFEVYSSIPDGMKIWESILEQGKGTVLPCGLASRDSLRLEARYPLYGHELNMELTPVESGIGWIVKEKTFQGSERILSDKKNGVSRKVLGFLLDQAGVPREGYSVVDASGQTLGQVLSGGYSPVLKKGMGTALLPASLDQDSIFIEIRGQRIPAHIVKGPFVKGSARSKK